MKKKKPLCLLLLMAMLVSVTVSAAAEEALQEELTVGDTVIFGSYEQDNDLTNGSEPIEWVVLDRADGKALLLSRYALDARAYNEGQADVTWEDCTLRAWLNGEFFSTAFSFEEQAKLLSANVINDDSTEFGTCGGNRTEDKVFLLSLAEAEKYFDSDDARKCAPTDYAVMQIGYYHAVEEYIADFADKDAYMAEYDGEMRGTWWWRLRSPGESQDYAAYVYYGGSLRTGGAPVSNSHGCARPALWVRF